MTIRPLSISIISWLSIASGILGMITIPYIVLHPEMLIRIGNPLLSTSPQIIVLCLLRAAQLITAIGMLKAKNWARYLYLFSMLATFVWCITSSSTRWAIFSVVQAFAIVFFLFRPKANEYFRPTIL